MTTIDLSTRTAPTDRDFITALLISWYAAFIEPGQGQREHKIVLANGKLGLIWRPVSKPWLAVWYGDDGNITVANDNHPVMAVERLHTVIVVLGREPMRL